MKDEEILKNVFILQFFLVDIFWILKWKSGIKRFYFTIRGEQVRRRRSYSIPSRSDPLLLGWCDIQNRKYDICSVERRFLSKLAIFYKLPQNLDEMINMWTRCLYIFFSAVQFFSISCILSVVFNICPYTLLTSFSDLFLFITLSIVYCS